jgi:hypothetical protein
MTHPFGNFFARDLLVADVDGNGSLDIVTVNAKKLSVRLPYPECARGRRR